MEQADVLIVGAGLLGCFAARALSALDLKILVLEQREDVCTGVSRANTGIVYSGCDTKPGSLKTALCLRANRDFGALCRELDVPFSRCGSLLVSFGPRAESVLERKFTQGLQNGVPGLALLDRAQVLAREPGLSPAVTGGLYIPGTGTVEPWALGIAAFENARDNGVDFRFCETLLHMERQAGGFFLESEKGTYRARTVLNCAGLQADRVRELLEAPSLRLFPDGADYLVLDHSAAGLLRHVVFHEPEAKGKGLTLVPTVSGSILLGPTERPLGGQAGDASSGPGLAALEALCRRVFPALSPALIIRSFGARRPIPRYVRRVGADWTPEGRNIPDFPILEEDGLFSLIGIKTPGLTCAWELGKHMAGKIAAFLGCDRQNPAFSPTRRGIPSPRDMEEESRAALVAARPEYGKILCRCLGVTQGEVLEAIRRGAVTADGVKRRCGPGLGRCQGGHCTQAILELLARETGRPAWAICKDGPDSPILYGEQHGTV